MEEAKEYLEKQFKPRMTWDNYGGKMNDPKKTWHLDHIIPQCEFKYTSLQSNSSDVEKFGLSKHLIVVCIAPQNFQCNLLFHKH